MKRYLLVCLAALFLTQPISAMQVLGPKQVSTIVITFPDGTQPQHPLSWYDDRTHAWGDTIPSVSYGHASITYKPVTLVDNDLPISNYNFCLTPNSTPPSYYCGSDCGCTTSDSEHLLSDVTSKIESAGLQGSAETFLYFVNVNMGGRAAKSLAGNNYILLSDGDYSSSTSLQSLFYTYMHESGHALGRLAHAGSLNCQPTQWQPVVLSTSADESTLSGGGVCVPQQYGDLFDWMGSGGLPGPTSNGYPTSFQSDTLIRLGWAADTSEIWVTSGDATVTINAIDQPGLHPPIAVHIPLQGAPAGYYYSLMTYSTGAVVRLVLPPNDANPIYPTSRQLRPTPTSDYIPLGQTLVDPTWKISITLTAHTNLTSTFSIHIGNPIVSPPPLPPRGRKKHAR